MEGGWCSYWRAAQLATREPLAEDSELGRQRWGKRGTRKMTGLSLSTRKATGPGLRSPIRRDGSRVEALHLNFLRPSNGNF